MQLFGTLSARRLAALSELQAEAYAHGSGALQWATAYLEYAADSRPGMPSAQQAERWLAALSGLLPALHTLADAFAGPQGTEPPPPAAAAQGEACMEALNWLWRSLDHLLLAALNFWYPPVARPPVPAHIPFDIGQLTLQQGPQPLPAGAVQAAVQAEERRHAAQEADAIRRRPLSPEATWLPADKACDALHLAEGLLRAAEKLLRLQPQLVARYEAAGKPSVEVVRQTCLPFLPLKVVKCLIFELLSASADLYGAATPAGNEVAAALLEAVRALSASAVKLARLAPCFADSPTRWIVANILKGLMQLAGWLLPLALGGAEGAARRKAQNLTQFIRCVPGRAPALRCTPP